MRNIKIKTNVPEVKFTVSAGIERTLEKMKTEIDLMAGNIPWYKRGAPDIKTGIMIYKMNTETFREQIDCKRAAIVNLETELKNIRRTVDEFRAIKATIKELWNTLDKIDTDLKTNILIFFYSDFFE